MSNIKQWVLATRPKTLPIGACPVIIGLSIASQSGPIDWNVGSITLLCSILLQIGANLANDYFDHQKGGDTDQRLGPTRAIKAGLISEHAIKRAMTSVFSITFLLGLSLVYHAGWPILVIGLVSIGFGLLYTATPFSLAYTGTADIFAFLFFGPIAVLGTVYVQRLIWDVSGLEISVAVGLIAMSILVVNNLRDANEDRQTGKKTLIVRWGSRFGKAIYTLCLVGAFGLLLTYTFSESWIIFPLSALLLLMLHLIRKVWIYPPEKLNPILGQTGIYLVLLTLIFCIRNS